MAKPGERGGNTGSAVKDTLPVARAEPGNLLGRLGGILLPRRRYVDVPATPTKGATASTGNQRNGAAPASPAPARQRSGTSRFLFGAMIYILGTYLLQIPLLLANAYFNLRWDRTVVYTFPKSFPFLGGSKLTVISLIYFALLIALLWALYRFNILPRDPFGTRDRAATARGATTASATPTVTHRRSAALRRARRASQAASASNGSSAKAATTTTSAGRASTTTSARRAPTPAATVTARTDDETYERVKALQRARRRRK